MKNINLYLVTLLAISPLFVLAQNSKSRTIIERKIRELDLAHAEAILKKDTLALEKLMSKDITVYNPQGKVIEGIGEIKNLIRSGIIDYLSFKREIETVLIYNKTVIVMGKETVVSNSKDLQTREPFYRRYTNIWIKNHGKWLLSARHANVSP